MTRALCVIAQSTTVALRLAAGRGDRRLFLSYAEQVPLAAEFDSLTSWMTDAYAARLHLAGLAPALAAPPWDWLSGLDAELLGRAVVSTTLDQVPDGRMFLEPALLKLVDVTAGVWDARTFRRAALAGGASAQLQVQLCHDVLELDHEHRFVVCDGEVFTGSPYRVGGRAWHRALSSPSWAGAEGFARHAVEVLGSDCPPVCSLDVGWDVRARRWMVVEANPLWASTPYSCDPEVFVDAVDRSNTAGAGRWAWQPETTQLLRAADEQEVVAVGEAAATGYAEFAE